MPPRSTGRGDRKAGPSNEFLERGRFAEGEILRSSGEDDGRFGGAVNVDDATDEVVDVPERA